MDYSVTVLILVTCSSVCRGILIREFNQERPNPVVERPSRTFQLTALLDDEWDRCTWYHDGIHVCAQSRGSTAGNPVDCRNTTSSSQVKVFNNAREEDPSTRTVSGGTYDLTACKLVINPFERYHTGNWSIYVEKLPAPGDVIVSTAAASRLVHSTQPPTMTFDRTDDEIQMAQDQTLTITCNGTSGRPTPSSFKWTLRGETLTGSEVGPFVVHQGQPDQYGYFVVSQTLTKNGFATLGPQDLKCFSLQEAGGYDEEENFVLIPIYVTEGSGSSKLGGGEIAAIVVVSLLLIILLLLLIFLCITGRLVFSCCCRVNEEKKSRKEKEKEAVRRRMQLEKNRQARIEAEEEARMRQQRQQPVLQVGYVVGQDFKDDRSVDPLELQLTPNRFFTPPQQQYPRPPSQSVVVVSRHRDSISSSDSSSSSNSSSGVSSSFYDGKGGGSFLTHTSSISYVHQPVIPPRNDASTQSLGFQYRRPPPPIPPPDAKSPMSKSPASGNQIRNSASYSAKPLEHLV